MKNETKAERFKRVAERRVQSILNGIESLSSLSNKKTYEWNEEQLTKIWLTIDQELKHCKESFKDPESRTFKL